MHHAEKRPLRTPQPPVGELTVVLWVIAGLLACLVVVWWLGHNVYS
jgi:hypothetical protein